MLGYWMFMGLRFMGVNGVGLLGVLGLAVQWRTVSGHHFQTHEVLSCSHLFSLKQPLGFAKSVLD